MSQSNELIVSQQSHDPVIALKRRKLEAIERMACRFKRVDIKFLAIPAKNDRNRPAFAILPLDAYRSGVSCTYSGNNSGYSWPGTGGTSAGNFADVFRKTNLISTGTSSPASEVPDEAMAIAQEVGREFDRIAVAWEADWVDDAGDPLMIGEIDGIWFLLAKWDTTALESYIAE